MLLLLAPVLVEMEEKYPSDFSDGAGAPSRLTLRLESSSFWQLLLPLAAGKLLSSVAAASQALEKPTCFLLPDEGDVSFLLRTELSQLDIWKENRILHIHLAN